MPGEQNGTLTEPERKTKTKKTFDKTKGQVREEILFDDFVEEDTIAELEGQKRAAAEAAARERARKEQAGDGDVATDAEGNIITRSKPQVRWQWIEKADEYSKKLSGISLFTDEFDRPRWQWVRKEEDEEQEEKGHWLFNPTSLGFLILFFLVAWLFGFYAGRQIAPSPQQIVRNIPELHGKLRGPALEGLFIPVEDGKKTLYVSMIVRLEQEDVFDPPRPVRSRWLRLVLYDAVQRRSAEELRGYPGMKALKTVVKRAFLREYPDLKVLGIDFPDYVLL